MDDTTPARLSAAVNAELTRRLAEPLAPGLYLVATPLGNLADMTLRALAVLAAADVVYCEDTRHSAKLFAHFGLKPLTRPLHDHNEDAERGRALAELRAGKRIALISDAGTPLVSDPGYKLVRAAVAEGMPVLSVPGPSAVLAALTVSGLPPDAFFFAGFLPSKGAARRARIAELAPIPGSLVLFESPQRAAEALGDLADGLGDRPALLARELTKLHEDHRRGTLAELANQLSGRELKGEIVIVVGPPQPAEVSDAEILDKLAVARGSMSLKDAAKMVADALGQPRQRVYNLGLRSPKDL